MSINEDSSIELRKNIIQNEDKINNLRTYLNTISAERYNINNTNYNELKKNMEQYLGIILRYLFLLLIIFFLINLLLIYKNIIKKSKLVLLIQIFSIILIGILFYRYYKLSTIDKYLTNLEENNKSRLLELNSEENITNQKILNLKIEITNLYNLLKYISKSN